MSDKEVFSCKNCFCFTSFIDKEFKHSSIYVILSFLFEELKYFNGIQDFLLIFLLSNMKKRYEVLIEKFYKKYRNVQM